MNIRSSKIKFFRKVNKIKVIKGLQEYLDGLLLGDGSICIDRRNKTLSPCYEQTTRFESVEWAEKIKRDIEKFRLKCSINGPYNRAEVKIRTQVHPFFLQMRNRWYPTGKKKIARDLIINPIVLGNWYLGDGKLDKDDIIKIYTEAFSFEDVKFLSDSINKTIGIISFVKRNEKGNPIIVIRAAESKLFLSQIPDEFKLNCFSYKFNIKCNHQRMKWLPAEDEILGKKYGKLAPKLIGRKLKRPLSSIYHRANRLNLHIYKNILIRI